MSQIKTFHEGQTNFYLVNIPPISIEENLFLSSFPIYYKSRSPYFCRPVFLKVAQSAVSFGLTWCCSEHNVSLFLVPSMLLL